MSSRGSAAAAGLEGLLALAFRRGPALQANQLIHEVRQQVEAEEGRAVNYEVALAGRSWEHLRLTVAPRLALFLRGKRMSAPGGCGPAFISLFVDQELCFIRVADFFEHLRQIEGLDPEAFAAMVQRWEQTGRRAVAALPPPRAGGEADGGADPEP